MITFEDTDDTRYALSPWDGVRTVVTRLPLPRVALATCVQVPRLDPDSQILLAELRHLGVDATAQVWSDGTVDWSAFDLIVIRSCWDYHLDPTAFIAWAEHAGPLVNPPGRWPGTSISTIRRARCRWAGGRPDELARPKKLTRKASGAAHRMAWPVGGQAHHQPRRTRHRRLRPRRLCRAPTTDRARASAATGRTQHDAAALPGGHRRLWRNIDGVRQRRVSHSVRRSAVITGPDDGADHRFTPPPTLRVELADPSSAELAFARSVLARVPACSELLYARVDIVAGDNGQPRLMEVELIEPQLFLALSTQAVQRLARAITARAGDSAITRFQAPGKPTDIRGATP